MLVKFQIQRGPLSSLESLLFGGILFLSGVLTKMEIWNLFKGRTLGSRRDHGQDGGQAERGDDQVLLVPLPQLLVQDLAELVGSLGHHVGGGVCIFSVFSVGDIRAFLECCGSLYVLVLSKEKKEI